MANRGRSFKHLVSFNAGEWSPLLDARVDVEKYSKACRQLENAIIETYGAARRRPGLRYVAQAKHADRKCRLIEFSFSTDTAFVLEVGHEYMRFYKDRAQVLSSGSPYEIATPYQEAELFALQYAQINDVVYITHPSHAPRKLSRVTDTSWTLTVVAWTHPPLLDENVSDVTLTPSGTTGSITLTASAATFEASHVGAVFQVSYLRTDISVRKAISSNGSSSTMRVVGGWRLRTSGTWDADVLVERSYDGGSTWELVRKVESSSDSNYDTEGEEPLDALYRVTVENYSSHSSSPRAILELEDPWGRGYVEVTAFTSSTVVTGMVLTAKGLFGTAATKYWAEGAWSSKRGYPSAVTLFEQRLCFAGTTHQPATVRGSAVDDYENFEAGTTDTDAFAYTLAATERNAIVWLVAQRALLIGTTAGEWSMQGSNDATLTASNVTVRRHSNYGSANVQARLVNDVVLFAQRQALKVREMAYTYEKEGYVAPDLTLLAEHVTAGGILQTAYQRNGQSILWAVTGDGELVGMTYERDQDVVGWHRQTTQGTFESVACIYGTGRDEVWTVVKRQREVAGVLTTFRYVERMDAGDWEAQEDAFYVDAGVTYDSTATDTITGLGHLEGLTVSVLADGAVQPDREVVSGSITLDSSCSVVQVGLPYVTMVEPMRLDADGAMGVSMSQVKRIHEVSVRLYQSLGLTYGDGVTFRELTFRRTTDPMDAAPPLFTGEKEIEFDGDFDEDPRLIVKQTQPLPLCLLALVVKYAITGN